nr:hypothetical protein [Bacteroidota bacterium]
MKFIAVILSVYVMVLTAMPCADVFAADTNSVTLEVFEQSHSHSHDVDLCSPFCFCDCCQTLSQITKHFIFQINLVSFNLSMSSLVQDEIECAISFWRPPKI